MVLAELVRSKRSVPNDAAHDLLRLLSNKLATETPAQRRMARLGSLLDMVATGTGEFIPSPAYDAARDAAGEHGREYPSAAELGRYYGGWMSALRAAMRFYFEGGSARVAAQASGGLHLGYDPQEIISFYLRMCVDLGPHRRPRRRTLRSVPISRSRTGWHGLKAEQLRRLGQCGRRSETGRTCASALRWFGEPLSRCASCARCFGD
jgi:hypothetical protein